VRPQSQLFARSRFSAQEQAEVAQAEKPFPEQAESSDGEVGGGHIQRPSSVLGQQGVQDVGQTVGLVVDDVGDLQMSLF